MYVRVYVFVPARTFIQAMQNMVGIVFFLSYIDEVHILYISKQLLFILRRAIKWGKQRGIGDDDNVGIAVRMHVYILRWCWCRRWR